MRKEKISPEIGKRLIAYFSRYGTYFIAGLLCTAVVAGIYTLFLLLINKVIKAAVAQHPEDLDRWALLIIAVHLVKWVFSYGQTYFISAATQKIAVRLRNELYAHLQTLSLSFFERNKVGHLMSRMTNDVGLVQAAAAPIVQIVSAPLVIVGALFIIFRSNWQLALMSVIILPFMSYTMTKISRGVKGLTELMQIKLSDIAVIVQETLSGVRIVKSFGMEVYETSRFAEENQESYRAAMRAVRRSAAVAPTVETIGVAGIAFILWYGGTMVAKKAFHGFGVAELITFLLALSTIAEQARHVSRINITYYQTLAGAQRIFDVLDEEPEVKNKPDAVPLPTSNGQVEFRNVTFAYGEGQPVLKDISFTAEPGKQVALVGPSGAGKSTIANLIPRFYDVSDGCVLVDGYDVRDVTIDSLRQLIGNVPQETMLFGTTIRENIAYGKQDATDEEIIEAAKAANAHNFIEKLEDGYNTLVGERGTRLSGGERQRIAIARALLKNPRILILDEATSSLDVASEAVVQEALERLMKGRTTVVIAHRLSTIVNADKILVMRQGQIVESGSHTELMANGGLYAELYTVQSKGAHEKSPAGGIA